MQFVSKWCINLWRHLWKSTKKKDGSHELIVSDDLYCHLLAGSGSVPGSDHIAEYTLASVAVHIIAFVQRLPDVHS